MRLLSTRTHGYLDYSMAILLLVSPWLFGFYDEGPATWVPLAAGMATILYSLFTRYETGAFQTIPMGIHLVLDIIQALLLGASPWLFGFADRVWQPHLILGIVELVVVLMTSRATAVKNIHGTAPAS